VNEDTAILDRHSSKVCSGTRYWIICTRWGLARGGGGGYGRRGSVWELNRAQDPVWFRTAVGRVRVSPTCREMC
jgi:hypothetical protein